MRAVIAVLCALAAGACHGKDDRAKATIAPAPAPPPPKPIATCDRYAAALDDTQKLDVDPEVKAVLRDEAAFVRTATRAPRDADRDELTVRCATALLDLGRVPTADSYGVGAVVPAAPTNPPAASRGPHCRSLFAAFARVDACPDISDDFKDTFRQQRDVMSRAWSQVAQDPDVQLQMEEGCRIAADSLAQILSQYHCP